MENLRTYSQDHPYRKDAKAFINGLKKREQYIAMRRELMQPILEQHGVEFEFQVPQEFWSSIEWKCSNIKKQCSEISGKHIRLNRRLEKLKWGYWAVNPQGEEYCVIYPKNN